MSYVGKGTSSQFYRGDGTFATVQAGDIGAGNVSSTEFDYLAGVGANIQTQIDNLVTEVARPYITAVGHATLVAGTVTVSENVVTATCEVILSLKTAGGTPGFLAISATSVGNSFTVTSTSGADTSVVSYIIVEPPPS